VKGADTVAQVNRFRESRYLVIDNLLSGEDFHAAGLEFDCVDLRPGLSDIEPIYDGMSYRGKSSTIDCADRMTSPLKLAIRDQLVASFGADEACPNNEIRFSVNSWGYPSGSRLSWHNDGGTGRLGAFVFFVHEKWSAGWGGELAVLDIEARSPGTADPFSAATTGLSPVMLWPRPNRLVLLKSYTPHSILRVDTTAGDRLRKTFSGFVSNE